MEQKPTLKLNRQTGKYELTIGIDAGIFQRELFAYATREHLDPTNQEEWQRAVAHVSRLELWLDHPHADVLAEMPVWAGEASKPTPPPSRQEQREGELEYASLSYEQKQALRERASLLPVDEWDTLLTPIPETLNAKEKQWYYRRRRAERVALDQLQQETTPEQSLDLVRVEAIAQAVKSNGLH